MRTARFIHLLVSFAATPLCAQRDTTARITGTAISALNGEPLAGVMIAVPAAQQFVVTDSTGTFEVTGLTAGRQKVRIAYAGRETKEYEFELRQGKKKQLAVVLNVEAVDLAPVVVEASNLRAQLGVVGFYERRKTAFGRFFTAEDIERLHPVSLGWLLNMTGISTRCSTSRCVPVQVDRGGYCQMPLYWNGVATLDINSFRPDELTGLEIYRRPVQMPPEFPSSDCGAVIMWTY